MTKSNWLLNIFQRIIMKSKVQTLWRAQHFLVSIKIKFYQKYLPLMRGKFYQKPLICCCSCYVGSAKMAGYIARELDKKKVAEMACFAGLGGEKKEVIQLFEQGRSVFAIDGCHLACAKVCLHHDDIIPQNHFDLSAFGVEETPQDDFDLQQANHILNSIVQTILNDKKMPFPSFYN
jgi:uncharacterized metal-binding protein